LAALARRYALAPLQTATGKELAWLERRSSEVGALCRLVYAELDGRPLVRPGGALLLPEAPGGLLCLDLIDRRPSAVIVADRMSKKSLGARLLTRAHIPTIASVGGLYAWVREGDPLAIDADEGVLHVHPSPELAARVRRG
jgi:signal transduction protein with GAF and PtsI domain